MCNYSINERIKHNGDWSHEITNTCNFAKIADVIEVPDLIEVQQKGYGVSAGDVASRISEDIGLKCCFGRFPIVSHDKTISWNIWAMN